MASENTDEIPGLLDSLELVDNAIALVRVALNQNPGMDDTRALNQQVLRLQAERGVLEAEINAAVGGQAVQGPSSAQHAAIAALSTQVESAVSANAAAGQAINLASRVLGLISQVVSA